MTDYDLSGLRVLIVDDYQPMRLILKNVLFALGIKDVAEASDGETALEQLRNYRADIVMTDNLMEPMGGVELVRRIRAGDSGADPYTPIIMVSGFSDLEKIIESRDSGINEFLAKPISAKLVYLRIQSVIENPRTFVRSDAFFGPDRRRRALGVDGEERRGEEFDYTSPKRDPNRQE